MRICVQKSTGRLLEMQSAATPGTLLSNCQTAYPEIPLLDMEERVITQEEWKAIDPSRQSIHYTNGAALEVRKFEKLAETDPLKALLYKEGIR